MKQRSIGEAPPMGMAFLKTRRGMPALSGASESTRPVLKRDLSEREIVLRLLDIHEVLAHTRMLRTDRVRLLQEAQRLREEIRRARQT